MTNKYKVKVGRADEMIVTACNEDEARDKAINLVREELGWLSLAATYTVEAL